MNNNWLNDDEKDETAEEISTLTLSEVSKCASGVCDQCHERDNAAPVIDVKLQCPNCDKV